MNPIQIIATLRKFGNYIVGLFPILAVLAERLSSIVGKLKKRRAIRRLRARFRKSKRARALVKFFERFYWRTYSKDRLIFDPSLGEAIPLLRRTLQLCVLLCLSIPITQFRWWPLAIETFSGFKTTVPAWVTGAWLIAMPIGWSAVLVGAAQCNRIVFAVAAAAALYFLSTPVLFAERSYINMFLGVSVLIVFRYSEQKLTNDSRTDLIRSIAAALIVGAAAGVQLMLLSPLKPFLSSILPIPGPVIGIGGGAIMGILVASVILISLRAPFPALAQARANLRPNINLTAIIVSLLLIAYLIAAIFRSSATVVAGAMVSSLSLINNYMWPMWYFIGVGILHKIMGSSKVVASVVEEVVPKKVVTPALIVVLFVGLLATSSEALSYAVSGWTAAPEALQVAAASLLRGTEGPIWSNPTNATSAHWMTWVLSFDLLIIFYLAIRKRLTADTTTRLFYLTCLSWLLISEYLFQLSSFTKTSSNSAFVLFLFSAWLLWLVHTVGWGTAQKSSPLWPTQGRLLLLAGVICIAMLQIQARAAIQDFKVQNELFLTMFHGVIDIGLPYYLYIWASRTVQKFPVRVPAMLGLFTLGALVALAFNATEKLAICGWSVSNLEVLVQKTIQQLTTTGSPNIDLATPQHWFLLRAIIYVCLLGLIYLKLRARIPDRYERGRACVFLWLAFVSGIASFSKTLVDLPVPLQLTALIAPVTQELVFNCNVFQSYLGLWIPTMLLLLPQLRTKPINSALTLALIVVAVGLNYGISVLFSTYEYYVRSAGLAYLVISILLGVFSILVALVLTLSERKTETTVEPHKETPSKLDEQPSYLDDDDFADVVPAPPARAAKAHVLSPRSFIGMVLVVEALLVPLAAYRLFTFKLLNTEVPSLNKRVDLSDKWQRFELPTVKEEYKTVTEQAPTDPRCTRFTRKCDALSHSLLCIGKISNSAGLADLQRAALPSDLPGFAFRKISVIKSEKWSKLRPNTVAVYFSCEPLHPDSPVMGGVVMIVPDSDADSDYFLLLTSPSQIEQERWEVPLAIQSNSM